ncbi:DUF4149 domain-containing protein [Elioraea sp. Yellowstone]|jgi:hypothetical protein|uniref:DUF4149 domain-containing protein n=1 Tax=Elioraea sp. Yellowstone TaxID=2592070 RepID=UPI001154B9CE|nr:DUF4149 domain-containing protein [Elioraea sp. Yellowstone]TQF81116.1 DUF4149 domain-containing protein [Elioraea sp. Yellowstone]
MEALATGVGLFATALLLGGMAFFAFVVAPAVFRALGAEAAGAFLRRLFPVYYVWCAGMAATAAVALVPLAWEAAGVMAIVAAGFVFARQALMPRINAYRDAARAGDASAQARFVGLHRLSVAINLAQMLLAALVLVGFAGRAW